METKRAVKECEAAGPENTPASPAKTAAVEDGRRVVAAPSPARRRLEPSLQAIVASAAVKNPFLAGQVLNVGASEAVGLSELRGRTRGRSRSSEREDGAEARRGHGAQAWERSLRFPSPRPLGGRWTPHITVPQGPILFTEARSRSSSRCSSRATTPNATPGRLAPAASPSRHALPAREEEAVHLHVSRIGTARVLSNSPGCGWSPLRSFSVSPQRKAKGSLRSSPSADGRSHSSGNCSVESRLSRLSRPRSFSRPRLTSEEEDILRAQEGQRQLKDLMNLNKQTYIVAKLNPELVLGSTDRRLDMMLTVPQGPDLRTTQRSRFRSASLEHSRGGVPVEKGVMPPHPLPREAAAIERHLERVFAATRPSPPPFPHKGATLSAKVAASDPRADVASIVVARAHRAREEATQRRRQEFQQSRESFCVFRKSSRTQGDHTVDAATSGAKLFTAPVEARACRSVEMTRPDENQGNPTWTAEDAPCAQEEPKTFAGATVSVAKEAQDMENPMTTTDNTTAKEKPEIAEAGNAPCVPEEPKKFARATVSVAKETQEGEKPAATTDDTTENGEPEITEVAIRPGDDGDLPEETAETATPPPEATFEDEETKAVGQDEHLNAALQAEAEEPNAGAYVEAASDCDTGKHAEEPNRVPEAAISVAQAATEEKPEEKATTSTAEPAISVAEEAKEEEQEEKAAISAAEPAISVAEAAREEEQEEKAAMSAAEHAISAAAAAKEGEQEKKAAMLVAERAISDAEATKEEEEKAAMSAAEPAISVAEAAKEEGQEVKAARSAAEPAISVVEAAKEHQEEKAAMLAAEPAFSVAKAAKEEQEKAAMSCAESAVSVANAAKEEDQEEMAWTTSASGSVRMPTPNVIPVRSARAASSSRHGLPAREEDAVQRHVFGIATARVTSNSPRRGESPLCSSSVATAVVEAAKEEEARTTTTTARVRATTPNATPERPARAESPSRHGLPACEEEAVQRHVLRVATARAPSNSPGCPPSPLRSSPAATSAEEVAKEEQEEKARTTATTGRVRATTPNVTPERSARAASPSRHGLPAREEDAVQRHVLRIGTVRVPSNSPGREASARHNSSVATSAKAGTCAEETATRQQAAFEQEAGTTASPAAAACVAAGTATVAENPDEQDVRSDSAAGDMAEVRLEKRSC